MPANPYQNAYDTALHELTDIANQFEQLRARKELIENVVQALQPFFATEATDGQISAPAEPTNEAISAENVAGDAEPPAGYSFRDVPSPLPDLDETGGDPFQRRVKTTFRFKGLATQRS